MKSKNCNLKWAFILAILLVNLTFLVKASRAKIGSRKLEKIEEDGADKKNGTNSSFLSLFRVDKWTAPRFIAELTNSFNGVGLPATAMAGIGFVLLLPIYLASTLISWLPLKDIVGSSSSDDLYYDSYRAPAKHHGYPSATPSPHYGYAAPSPQYGYHAPAPSQNYGYHAPPPSTPSPHYGYPTHSSTTTPSTHYGYPAAPAPAPAPHYGYPEAPAPSPQYGYHYSSSASHDNYAYSPPDQSAPTHGYSAIHSAPAPSVQYGSSPKPSSSYGAPVADVVEPKSDDGVAVRKARSVRANNEEERCMERLACEISKATKGLKLPEWMNALTGLTGVEQNEIVAGARRLLTGSHGSGCKKFRCSTIEKQ